MWDAAIVQCISFVIGEDSNERAQAVASCHIKAINWDSGGATKVLMKVGNGIDRLHLTFQQLDFAHSLIAWN